MSQPEKNVDVGNGLSPVGHRRLDGLDKSLDADNMAVPFKGTCRGKKVMGEVCGIAMELVDHNKQVKLL
jgi:hypothetical protein